MLGTLATKLALKLLKSSALSVGQKNLLTGAILDSLGGAPIRDTLQLSETGQLLVNGVLPDIDVSIQLREAAKLALSNPALKLVWEQVKYTALIGGASLGEKPEDLFFYRTAIWNGEQERNWLRQVAGVNE